MGTISEKLTYLNDTRLKIKDGLNKFGADLTENDTFRSYSNVLNNIYDKLPKVSANGSNFSLENAQNGKLDSFGMDGNTEQDSYSGKNLLAYTSYGEEKQGITTTYDSEDGALILNGTANNTFSSLTKESSIDIATGTYTFSTKEAKNYNIRLMITCTDNTTINVTIDKGSTSTTVNVNKATLNQRIFIYENNTFSGTTFTNEKIYAQLESGSTATSFEPYVGGTPSPNPDYPQDVKVVTGNNTIKVTEKNLFDKNNANIVHKQAISNSTFRSGNPYISIYIPAKEGKTYTISSDSDLLDQYSSLYFTSEDLNTATTYLLRVVRTPETATSITATAPIGTKYVCAYILYSTNETDINSLLSTIQIEENSIATTYEPYQSQDYEIDLGNIELCKIGDYKDVIFKNNQLSEYYDSTLDEDSWYIKKSIGKVVLDGDEGWANFGSNLYTLQTFFNDNPFIVGYGLSNLYKYNPIQSGIGAGTTNGEFALQKSGNNYNLFIKNTDIGTLENLKASLSEKNMIAYYPLSTPTYEKITNETLISQLESIETFTGLNYFSVSNDNNVLPTLYVSRLKELGKLE